MKNHIKVNGKLLQTNKRFSQLKQSQKDWMKIELHKLYHDKMKEKCTTKKLPPEHREEEISSLYEKIQQRDIWIPYHEVEKLTYSSTAKIVTSFKRKFPALTTEIEAEHATKKSK